MRVLLVTDEPHEVERLLALVGASFQIESAPPEALKRPEGTAARYEVAVGGYFPPEWLEAAVHLRHVVIPFAGVPRRTRQALAAFPHLAVYNSHYNAAYTAEHAWALLLAAAKRLLPADRRFRTNDWTHRYEGFPSVALSGGTLLLIGYGAIGKHLGRMGKAFGMRVLAVKRTPGEAPEIDVLGTLLDLPRLLPLADAVILSLPETDGTMGLLGPQEFARMKPGVLLVNVGRGPAIDEDAFFEALRSGRIGAAGIDTWWIYPKGSEEARNTPPSHHPLSPFENLVLSPHRASDVLGHDEAQLHSVALILKAIADGRPPRAVDRTEWY